VSRRIGLVSAVVCRPRRRHCSPCPPRKQLLAGVVRGAVAVGSGRHRRRRPPSAPSWPLAPAIPPASSRSQQGGGCWVIPGSCWGSSPSSLDRRITRDPPHEQLLMGLGAGGVRVLGRAEVGAGAVVVVLSFVRSPLSCWLWCCTRRARWGRWGAVASSTRTTLRASARSSGGRVLVFGILLSLPSVVRTRKPPYEQLLVDVVAGAVSSPLPRRVAVRRPPLAMHQPSSLRAVARRGGVWCGVPRRAVRGRQCDVGGRGRVPGGSPVAAAPAVPRPPSLSFSLVGGGH
jgi:hypothetical protein